MINKHKSIRIIAYIVAGAALVASLAFAFVTLSPVDVLKDWHQETVIQPVNGQLPSFQEGDTVDIVSTSNKVMDVDGDRRVYIDCIQDGIENRYDVSSASVGREVGQKTSAVHYIIPYGISNLPQTCHFTTIVTYVVFGIRTHDESVKTNDFIVNKRNPSETIVRESTVVSSEQSIQSQPAQNNQTQTQTGRNEEQAQGDTTQEDPVAEFHFCLPIIGICLI